MTTVTTITRERVVESRPRVPRIRLVLLAGAAGCLLLGLDAGLLLLGLPAPLSAQRLPDLHAQLMVIGFLGTLVALERAVALRQTWGFAAPLGTAAGSLLTLSALPLPVGQLTQLAGFATLLGVYVALWRRSPSASIAVQALGSVLGVGAVLLLLGGVAVPAVAPWLLGFLVLTIVGERLELATVGAPPPSAERLLVAASAGYALGAAATLLWPAVGTVMLGAATCGLVAWLLRFDVARRTVHATGLPRYMAVNMLCGTAWLGVAGAVWLVVGPTGSGATYDIVVHAVGVGFALSMVLAHAPVILPAVIRRPLPYSPAYYGVTAGLQIALLLRVIGDARDATVIWQTGGAATVVVILSFAAITVRSVLRR